MELTASEFKERVVKQAIKALQDASWALGEVWELTDDNDLLFTINAIHFAISDLKGEKSEIKRT